MALQKKRYYAWLFKAYFRRWKKTILGAIALSIFVSLGLVGLGVFYVMPLLAKDEVRTGYWGVYAIEDIPDEVIDEVSMGLVKIEPNGQISPAAAQRWEIKDNKEYTFYLRKDLKFHNGTKFSSKTIPFIFENVEKQIVDDYTVKYILKDPYSPFLTAVSEPILLKDLSGLGQYKIKDIELNAGFVRTLTLQNTKDSKDKKVYTFYPTEEALKVAYTLGEIDSAENIFNKVLDGKHDLTNWPKTNIEEKINEDLMVTVFFNTKDSVLSDKRMRQALHYALPSEIDMGKRLYSPIKESSVYFAKPPNYGISDMELAKEVLETAGGAPEETITIKTTKELEETAKKVQKAWSELGVQSNIEIISDLSQNFQVLIYEMKIPEDPDQYILWHSDQRNNIVGYKNLRIDKLLEDGRSITNTQERQEIYADFQKYLMDDLPASFFYHPKVYRIFRED